MLILLPHLLLLQIRLWFNRYLPRGYSWRLCLSYVCCIGLVTLGWPNFIQAQTATITVDNNKVTAAIPDHTSPSTPILISPPDGSWVTTQKPTFTWYPSSDDVGVDHYQLVIDGNIALDNISPSNNPSVTVSNALNDGTHTWKVIVFDAAGNSNTSATWTFYIDSQAPNFILKQLGEKTVNISAQDSSTWPTQPYVLTSNPVQLLATTESNSQVTVTVSWQGQVRQTLTSNATGDQWQALLGIVPRDVVITLDFLIRDHVDLVSILGGVQFIVPSISLPPLGGGLTPTSVEPTSAVPTPPGATPAVITPVISQPPLPPGLSWVWPGGQIAQPAGLPWFQEILLKITLHLPDAIARPIEDILTSPPATQAGWLSSLALWLGLFGSLLAWLWWLSVWGKAWWRVGWRGWWPILGWQRPQRHGWVLEDGSCRPLAGVKITVFARTLASLEPVAIETIFSDQSGQFALPHWPPPALTGPNGQYSLSFELPGTQQAAEFSSTPSDWPAIFTPFTYWHHRYHGGWLSLRREYPFPTVVSFLAKTATPVRISPLKFWIGTILTSWSQQRAGRWWLLWLGGLAVSALWGGWWNWLMVGHTTVIGLGRWWQWKSLKIWHLEVTDGPETKNIAGILVTSRQAAAEAWWVAVPANKPTQHLQLALPSVISSVIAQPMSVKPENIMAVQLLSGQKLTLLSQVPAQLSCRIEAKV